MNHLKALRGYAEIKGYEYKYRDEFCVVKVGDVSSTSTDDSVNIENVSINFNTGTISSDYDARRAGDMVKEEILKIARKAGNRSIARR